MPTRLEVELTSARPDGTWTWRAAGARQPKGVLDGSILYSGAQVGDVIRAEADVEIDGITILSVTPPKTKGSQPGRLEVIGPSRAPTPGVTSSLVSRSGRRPDGAGRDRRDDRPGERPERGSREGGGPRRERGRDGDRAARPERSGGARQAGGRDGPREGAGRDGARRGGPGREGPGREGPGREGPGRDGPRREGPRRDVPGRERNAPRGGTEGARPGPGRGRGAGGPGRPEEAEQEAGRSAPKRLAPGTVHRDAVLATLNPEQVPVAEQVLKGGIPAVRQAVAAESEKAAAEGRPAISAEPLVSMAEELMPRLKTALWWDRAEAAAAIVDEISIRDLRSVVAGADAARDDETRLLAQTLREALERRLEAQRTAWVQEMVTNLDEGRVVRALRLSARPPDPGVRFPAELAVRLAEAAGAALSADTSADRWVALLEAVGVSPVRRNVHPAGLPADAPEELLVAARHAAGRIPALAPLLGLPMPPPPGPARPPVRAHARPQPRPPRPAGPRPAPARPVPPAPPVAEAAPPAPPEPEAPAVPEAPAAPPPPVAEAVAAPEPAPEAPVAEAVAAPEPAPEAPVAPEPTGTEAASE